MLAINVRESEWRERSACLFRCIDLDVFVFIAAFILNKTHIGYLVVVVEEDELLIACTWLSDKVDDLQVG